jgi:hypothetical protein
LLGGGGAYTGEEAPLSSDSSVWGGEVFDGIGQVMSGGVYRSGFPEQPVRFAVPIGTVRRWFAPHGFRLRSTRADFAFARDLWVLAFERTPAAQAVGPQRR